MVKPPSPPPAPELPKTQPPTWQQWTEPPVKKPWRQKEAQPSWAAVTEQFSKEEVTPLPADKGFVTTRSERILESNLEYHRSQDLEDRPVTATAVHDFIPAGFKERFKQENFFKDGRMKFSSETETLQSEYESEIDGSPVAQPSPPKITQPLKDIRQMEGSDATFVCRISGRPRPKVAWYLNGHIIKSSSRYEMKFTKDGHCTLRIRMSLPEDAGHYIVLAENNLGKDICSSKLYVDRLVNIDSTSFVALP